MIINTFAFAILKIGTNYIFCKTFDKFHPCLSEITRKLVWSLLWHHVDPAFVLSQKQQHGFCFVPMPTTSLSKLTTAKKKKPRPNYSFEKSTKLYSQGLDRNSASKSRLKFSFKISTNLQQMCVTRWWRCVLGQLKAFMPLYIEKVEIWSGDTDASQTHSITDFGR